jgi:hypothetical protein
MYFNYVISGNSAARYECKEWQFSGEQCEEQAPEFRRMKDNIWFRKNITII